MGWIWWVAPLVVAISGGGLLLAGAGHLFQGRPARASGHVLIGAPLAIIGIATGLLGFNIQTYARLTHEGPVADVSVRAIDPAGQRYEVTVHRLDGTNSTATCEIQGDEWLISGRVQKWKPWANVLGLDSTYSLDQLSNKYFTADRANGKMITACDLNGPPPAVNRYVPDSWLAWLTNQAYTVDRRFGDANYMPLADGAVYRVVITQSGFNSEPANDIARKVNEQRS
ncbi:MAG: hypothetical protein ABSD74_15520 [Rhizomicrobium sp.]|jgi:hypothetical protein